MPEIWDSGLLLFIKHILRSPIEDNLVNAILTEIQTERDGYVINRSAVKGCVDVLLQLFDERSEKSVYARDLEPAVLKESEAFHKKEGIQLLQTCDAPEYLRRVCLCRYMHAPFQTDFLQVEIRFQQEESRAHHYLSSKTSLSLRRILEQTLLTPHLSTILSMPNSGLDMMIDMDKIDDLSRLYRLFIMVTVGVPTLRKALRESIIRRGRDLKSVSLNADADDLQAHDEMTTTSKIKGKGKARAAAASQTLSLALKWVQDVLDLKDKFDRIWVSAFQSDRDIESGMNEVCDLYNVSFGEVKQLSFRPSRRSSINMTRRQNLSHCSSMTI